MELLDGEDLFERLAHRSRLSLRETSKIVTQVARALSRAHAAGIVHRDLKPENVFLCPNEDDEVVKVLDFGVAKVKDAAKVTMQKTGIGTLIGTPHYMSPEQVKGIGEIDYRADLWALGVIAFQCVTGELPVRQRRRRRLADQDHHQRRPCAVPRVPGRPCQLRHVVHQGVCARPCQALPERARNGGGARGRRGRGGWHGAAFADGAASRSLAAGDRWRRSSPEAAAGSYRTARDRRMGRDRSVRRG